MSNMAKKKHLLSEEERTKAIESIQEYFRIERNEDIGIIAADSILDFFLETIGKDLCKKVINKFRENILIKLDDTEIETLQIFE